MLLKINAITNDKINEPNAPEYVFFGLIFVSFFPLNVFPNIYPPMSDVTQTRSTKINFKLREG